MDIYIYSNVKNAVKHAQCILEEAVSGSGDVGKFWALVNVP